MCRMWDFALPNRPLACIRCLYCTFTHTRTRRKQQHLYFSISDSPSHPITRSLCSCSFVISIDYVLSSVHQTDGAELCRRCRSSLQRCCVTRVRRECMQRSDSSAGAAVCGGAVCGRSSQHLSSRARRSRTLGPELE